MDFVLIFSILCCWAWLGVKSQLDYLQQCLPGKVLDDFLVYLVMTLFAAYWNGLACIVLKTTTLIDRYKCIESKVLT